MYKEPENLVIQESKETQSPGTNLKGLPLVKDEKFGLQKKKESYNDWGNYNKLKSTRS